MKIIGITGGIASGKSTATSILKTFGATIIDADILARRVVEKGQPTLKKLVNSFGNRILNNQGELNRKLLGKIVFNDREKLRKLNEITHPAINALTLSLIEEERVKGREKIVYDAPLLIEGNLLYLIDELWLIHVDESLQLERLMKRDGFTREEALERINSQMPLSEKKKYADVIVYNNGSIGDLEKELKKHWYR